MVSLKQLMKSPILPARSLLDWKLPSHQDGEPDFDLVEPRSVFGCEMEPQGMFRIAEKRLTRRGVA